MPWQWCAQNAGRVRGVGRGWRGAASSVDGVLRDPRWVIVDLTLKEAEAVNLTEEEGRSRGKSRR